MAIHLHRPPPGFKRPDVATAGGMTQIPKDPKTQAAPEAVPITHQPPPELNEPAGRDARATTPRKPKLRKLRALFRRRKTEPEL